MHKIDILPIAYEDLREAVRHILDDYNNETAAMDLMDDVLAQNETLKEFPYAHPLYHTKMKIPSEIRFFPVRNYNVFYQVLEPQHIVEVRRIIYARMDTREQNV